MNDRHIILLGSRGCGKTSVGRRLAAVLGRPFVDIDGRICERIGGLTVAMIWATAGEPAYRAVEDEVTSAACLDAGVVVALGGGTLMQSRSRTAVESADARRVYLRCDPAELFRRISDDPQSAGLRPGLTAHGGGLDEVVAVLRQREPVYRAVADEELDVTNLTIDDVIDRLPHGVLNSRCSPSQARAATP